VGKNKAKGFFREALCKNERVLLVVVIIFSLLIFALLLFTLLIFTYLYFTYIVVPKKPGKP
jgi:hypothetical protein